VLHVTSIHSVSSESTTPDEDQMPVMSDMKRDKPLSVDSNMGRPLSALSDGDTGTDHMIYVEMPQKGSPGSGCVDSIDTVESKASSSGYSDQVTSM